MKTKAVLPKKLTKRAGEPVRQFSVMLENKRGALGKLLSALKERGVLCLGLSTHDSREISIARLVVSNPEDMELAMRQMSVAYVSSDVVIVSMQHGPEAITECLHALSTAEINLNFLYPLFPSPFGNSLMVLHVDDYDSAHQVLTTAGFSVLYQQDISR